MNIIAFFVFIIIQILFIPLAIVGGILLGYEQAFVSMRLGVSATAVEVVNQRWLMDIFDIRKDEANRYLFRNLPNNSATGNWLRYKISGKLAVYLSKADVRNTIQLMRANSTPGSIIVADIYAWSFVTGEYL